MMASDVLVAVESWAYGAFMIRETEVLGEFTPKESCSFGRLDALIVPASLSPESPVSRLRRGWCWTRTLLGVEVKVSRSDFQRGVREGQFDRYREAVSGLFLACPHGVAKRSEVPSDVGLLLTRYDQPAICAKRPKLTDHQPSPEQFWKIIAELHRRATERERAIDHRMNVATRSFGQNAARALSEFIHREPAR